MGQPLEVHIRRLQEFYWSDTDPDGRGFVPLADALRRAGDFREAHRLLREGLGRYPDFLSGHVVAAWLSVDQGKSEDAQSSFGTALELDPKNIAALRGLAEVFLDRGEVGSALGFLESLLQEDPTDRDLPDRVLDLRAEADTLDEAGVDQELEPEPKVWDDPDGVAEELNWDSATLQPDSSPVRSPEGPEEEGPSVLVVEEGEPTPVLEEMGDALVTSTLGEIYLRQGLFSQSERVFQTLLVGDPENEQLKHHLEEVRDLLRAQEAEAEEGKRQIPAEEETTPISSLAPDESQEIPGEEEAPEEEGASGEEEAPEEVVVIEALAPAEVVPIESLAPDRLPPIPAAEPVPEGVISIDALAPDEVIPIDALAPDEVISIGALAPDEVISIDALAPDGPVPIEALAPEYPPHPAPGGVPEGDDSGRDPTIDAFERWLDDLQ